MVNPNKLFGRLGNRMFQMAFIYARVKDGLLPDIYVQDYRLFTHYEKEIKEWLGDGIGFIPYTSIHVRVAKNPSNPDEPAYMDNPFYVDLTKTDYYEKAIAHFPDSKFLVFSDDTEWVKKNMPLFQNPRFQIVEGGDELEDFNMLSSCENHIIANSSFSYWGAYLSPTPSKKVIAPSIEHWYTDSVERTICPPQWIRL